MNFQFHLDTEPEDTPIGALWAFLQKQNMREDMTFRELKLLLENAGGTPRAIEILDKAHREYLAAKRND